MSGPAPTAPAAEPAATIHDLGYKRYLGTRRPQATRWWVVSRQLLAHSWRSWWRVKLWIGLSLLVTVVVAAVMVAFRTKTFQQVGELQPVMKVVDRIVFDSIANFTKVAFLLSLTVGAGIVATDLRAGAFTFYFSRPVRPIDYLIGKLAALFLLQATVVLAPLVVIALVRLGVSRDQSELVANLGYLPKAVLIGTLTSATFASVSLAFSAMMASPRVNLAVWSVVYLIGIGIPAGVAVATRTWDLQVIDFPRALLALSHHLYGVEGPLVGDVGLPSLAASIASPVAYTLAGVWFSWWRINQTAYRGIGGT